MSWRSCWGAVAAVLLFCPGWAWAEDLGFQRFEADDGTKISYRLLAPPQKEGEYTVLLALPPGPQTVGMVEWVLRSYYQRAAEERGWVVVSPAAPGGRTFPREGRPYLPQLLEHVAETYPPQGGKFFVTGVSNGGVSSFALAVDHPELIHAVAVLPGWPTAPDLARVTDMKGVPLRMWAGDGERPNWLDLMRQAEETLRSAGADVELEILPGEGHTLQSLVGGAAVFAFFEEVIAEFAKVTAPR